MKLKLDFDAAKPIYQQIIDALCRAVARGELKPGDKVPSQRDMAAHLQVNPNTVQRAYRDMERDGLLETARGTGTFVTERPELLKDIKQDLAFREVSGFIEGLRALGYGDDEMLALLESEIRRLQSPKLTRNLPVTEEEKEEDEDDRTRTQLK